MNRRRPNGRACRVGGRPGFRAFPAPAACPAAARGRHRRRQHRTPAGPRLAPAPVPGRFVGRPCHSASRRDSGPTTRSGGQNRTRFPRNWPVNNAQPRVTMGSAAGTGPTGGRSWFAQAQGSGGQVDASVTVSKPCHVGSGTCGTVRTISGNAAKAILERVAGGKRRGPRDRSLLAGDGTGSPTWCLRGGPQPAASGVVTQQSATVC